MKDIFTCTEGQIEELKEKKAENGSSIVSNAITALIGLVSTAMGVTLLPYVTPLLLIGTPLAAVSIYNLVKLFRAQIKINKEKKEKENELEIKEKMR